MTEEEKKINTLFDTLDKWRLFPAYQLERRADIFFAVYLPIIFKKQFGESITTILPEFPVRIGSISSSQINKSYKIDYVVVCEGSNKVYFVELKTDANSKREKQDDYLKKASDANIVNLINGLLEIYKATEQKKKYENLLSEICELNWLKDAEGVYSNTGSNYKIEIVYIQPIKTENDKGIIIDFDDIMNSISNEQDYISKRFIESLEKWKTNPN